MKKIFILLMVTFIFIQCDDGDFDVPSFVFENNIDYCGDLIIHNIGQDDSEALILDLPITNSLDNTFFKTIWTNKEYNLTDKIYYRVFNDVIDSNYFCQEIPPSSPTIVNEWIGSGKLIINNSIIEDDLDGIEELDHTLNSDDDLIPNYLDKDDDNDSILTINEILDNDGDNIYETILDTDGDQIPNYLDNDDDGDGILTINEILDNNGNNIKDYLEFSIAVIQSTPGTIPANNHNLQYTMNFVIENMSLANSSGNAINYTTYEYGVKVGNFTITD